MFKKTLNRLKMFELENSWKDICINLVNEEFSRVVGRRTVFGWSRYGSQSECSKLHNLKCLFDDSKVSIENFLEIVTFFRNFPDNFVPNVVFFCSKYLFSFKKIMKKLRIRECIRNMTGPS